MNAIAASPPVGADSVRSFAPWQICICRAGEWLPVGACGDEWLVREHVKSLKLFMPGKEFMVFISFEGLFGEDEESEEMETVDDTNRMNIPAPKFLQWASVWRYHDNTIEPMKIVNRLYDPDAGIWLYKMEGLSGLVREQHLSTNPDDFLILPTE